MYKRQPPDGSPDGASASASSEPSPPDWFLIDRGLTGDAGQLARREHARLQRWVGAWLDDFEAAWLELTADARRSTLARASERIGAKCLAASRDEEAARRVLDGAGGRLELDGGLHFEDREELVGLDYF